MSENELKEKYKIKDFNSLTEELLQLFSICEKDTEITEEWVNTVKELIILKKIVNKNISSIRKENMTNSKKLDYSKHYLITINFSGFPKAKL